MDAAQKFELKCILEKDIAETELSISKDMRALESFESKQGDTFDRAKSSVEAELVAKLQDHKQLQLRKLRYALKQLFKDSYGFCDNCGCDIGFERMQIVPTTTACISCKEAEEMEMRKVSDEVVVSSSAMSGIFVD